MMRLFSLLDTIATAPATAYVATAWRGMMNLLLPNPCALCVWADAVRAELCGACQQLLKDQTRQVIQAQEFADALPLDMITGRPLPVFAAAFYTPEIAKMLLQYKDHQRIHLARAYRPIMYRTLRVAVDHCAEQSCAVVPIPASGASFRKRGYNPVTTMLPRHLPAPARYEPGLLKHRGQLISRAAHHGTGVQTRRAASQRKFRLAVRRKAPAEPIVLVDDVLTSGATLAGATRTLQNAGYDVAAAVVLASVMPRS